MVLLNQLTTLLCVGSCDSVCEISSYALDSRKVEKGSLFFALKGEKVDGHSFLSIVAEKGASAAMVDESYRGPDYGLSLWRVPDVRLGLQALAREVLVKRRAKVVGITGSVGKTTAKEFLTTLLKQRYHVDANRASYNSQLTLPLTILQADPQAELLILEMGMSQPKEIATLVSIAPPDVALITTIGVSHAHFFTNGREGIAQEKAEIFSHPMTRRGLFLEEMPYAYSVAVQGSCAKERFSLTNPEADYYLKKSSADTLLLFEKGKLAGKAHWPICGDHLLSSFLAAIAAARAIGLDYIDIEQASWELKLPPMRLQQLEKRGICFVNDAYNSSPESVKGALFSLPSPSHPGRKKIAVIGEMRELGEYTEEAHRQVGHWALETVDEIFCLGEACRFIQEVWQGAGRVAELFSGRDELIRQLRKEAQKGDVVLLKGSRSLELERIFEEF